MGKLHEFSIRLDNEGGVYTPGDIVSGKLVVRLSEPMKVRGIRVTVQGRAGVNWKETADQTDDDNKKTAIVHFNAEEVYLNHRQIMWGQDSDTSFVGVLPPGDHEFPFSVNLPKNLPCSFEGDHGCISYKIKATIDKPWKKDHNVKIFFTVIGTYDLNNDPHASELIEHSAEQTVCCGCCKAGHFALRYYIERRGYVPGEEIPLVVEVKNKSSRRLLSEVKFKMVTTYFAHDDSKKQEEELDRFDMDPVSANSSGTLRTTIDIPPTPPSHLMGCDIIDVDYVVRLKVVPEGCSCESVDFHDEILVGTVPLHHVVAKMLAGEGLADKALPVTDDHEKPRSTLNAEPRDTPLKERSTNQGTISSVLAALTLSTPVYAKCVHSKGNVLDDDGIAATGGAFTPQYTFYNWKQLVNKMKSQASSANASIGQPLDKNITRDSDPATAECEQNNVPQIYVDTATAETRDVHVKFADETSKDEA